MPLTPSQDETRVSQLGELALTSQSRLVYLGCRAGVSLRIGNLQWTEVTTSWATEARRVWGTRAKKSLLQSHQLSQDHVQLQARAGYFHLV